MTETQSGTPGASADSIDDTLLTALSRDGRAGVEALARETGLSRAVVRQRTHRLLTEVVDVVGIVHPAVFGLTEYAHLRVTPSGSAAAAAAAVADRPGVPFVSITAGDVPVVAEARARSRAELADTIAGIAADPAVATVETTVYLAILADAAVPARVHGTVPGQSPSVDVDHVDRRLLGALQRDGRTSYSALAELVGLSVGATRARVLRLLETGVVHIGVRPRPSAAGLVQAGVAFPATGAPDDLAQRVGEVAGVTYLATTLGRWSLLATVQAESLPVLAERLDAVRAVPGAGPIVTWTHLRVVKERYQDDLIDSRPSG